MKQIIVIIFLAIAYTSSAQIEFEEVFKIYPDEGVARQSKVYFKLDTIFLETMSTHNSKGSNANYFISLNEGNKWEKITEELSKEFPITEPRDYLGEFHPLGFYFIRMNFTENDTSLYYINLKGDIIKKVKYPFKSNQSILVLNPNDPDFISVHRQIHDAHTEIYRHDVGYTTDMGETWDYLQPEPVLFKERGVGLINQRKIDFFFSEKENGKMLIQFSWESKYEPGYNLTTAFNYLAKQYDFSENYIDINSVLCFECFEENELTKHSFISTEIFTNEKKAIPIIQKTLNIDIDSLDNENKIVNIGRFGNSSDNYFKINPLNFNHKVLLLTLVSEDTTKFQQFRTYINQIFFQTFDNGESWEYIFENESVSNQVVDFFINHINNDLWILKDSTLENTLAPQSESPVLYKSKTPLTSVENNTQNENKTKAYFSENDLIIESEEMLFNSIISIYDLEGKKIESTSIDIQKGVNEIKLNQKLSIGLYLVDISNSSRKSIVKLIRSD